jgi:hypothetical protein
MGELSCEHGTVPCPALGQLAPVPVALSRRRKHENLDLDPRVQGPTLRASTSTVTSCKNRQSKDFGVGTQLVHKVDTPSISRFILDDSPAFNQTHWHHLKRWVVWDHMRRKLEA